MTPHPEMKRYIELAAANGHRYLPNRLYVYDGRILVDEFRLPNRVQDIRRCELCFAVHEWAPACPYCGNIYPVQQREIHVEEGDLRELTPEEIQDLEEVARKTGKLSAFHAVAKARGQKPGHAFHQWKRWRAGRTLEHARVANG